MKTKQTLFVMMTVLTTLLIQNQSFALGNSEVTATAEVNADHRMTKRIGAYVGILGDPHPTLAGINLAYNVNEFMRASVGLGKVSVSSATLNGNNNGFSFSNEEKSMTTIGAAAKFLVPRWNLSPSATVGYSHVAVDDGMTVDYKANNFYLGFGADWQDESGLNLGAGVNLSVNDGAPTAPYINVGMFF